MASRVRALYGPQGHGTDRRRSDAPTHTEDPRVSIEEQQHQALPKLYGAPAYGRPQIPVEVTAPRPFDPDELPIEAAMTDEEREFAATLPASAYAPGGTDLDRKTRVVLETEHRSLGRPFRLKSITGRLTRAR
jgi:hypothetical protein